MLKISGKNSKGKTDNSNDKDDDDNNTKKEKQLPGRGSLMFKSSSDVSVPFFGSPFTVETTIYYTCSQGIKYYGSKQYPDEMVCFEKLRQTMSKNYFSLFTKLTKLG